MKNKEVTKVDSYKSLSKKFKVISKKPFFNTPGANKKRLKKLSDLSTEIDVNVIHIAPKRFVRRKDEKLKKLSELKQLVELYKVDAERQLDAAKKDIENSIISKIINAKNTATEVLTKEIKPLELIKKSLVDKKYRDKTSEEILSMVYGKPKKDKKKEDEPEKGAKDPTKPIFDTAIKEAAEKSINTPAVSQEDDRKKEDSERILNIEDRLESIDKNIVLLSETIKKVQENSVDRQDTSINTVKKKEISIPLSQQKEIIKEPEKQDNSWLSFLMNNIGKFVSGWLASKAGLALLTGLVKNTAKSILKAGIKGLGKVAAGVGTAIGAGLNKLRTSFSPDKQKPEIKDEPKRVSRQRVRDGKAVRATKPATKLSANVASKSGSILRKMTRFTKVVPILGTVLAAGSAAYAAYEGYNNASEILGKSVDQLTETDKLASAAGSVVSDLSFGWISPTSVAEKIVNVFGDETSEPTDDQIEQAEKINMEIPLDMSNATPEEKVLIRRIKNIEQYILEDERSIRGETNRDRIRVKNESIEKLYNELRNLYKEYNEKFYNATPGVEKSRNMFEIEQTQEATVQNTRLFSRGNTVQRSERQVSNTNLSINNHMADDSGTVFDSFLSGGY